MTHEEWTKKYPSAAHALKLVTDDRKQELWKQVRVAESVEDLKPILNMLIEAAL